jgi:hypothetical protein
MHKALVSLMVISGVLSLVGLIALPLDNMQVRIIGIVGYAIISIGVFLLLGIILGKTDLASPADDRTTPPESVEKAQVFQQDSTAVEKAQANPPE